MITLYYASIEFLLCVGIDECNGRISSCLPCDEYNVRIYFICSFRSVTVTNDAKSYTGALIKSSVNSLQVKWNNKNAWFYPLLLFHFVLVKLFFKWHKNLFGWIFWVNVNIELWHLTFIIFFVIIITWCDSPGSNQLIAVGTLLIFC